MDSQITNNVDNIDSYKFPSKNNLLYDDINDDSNLFANVCVDDKQKPNNKVIHVINSTYNPNIETNNVTNTYCKSEVSPHTNTYDTKEIYKN